MYLHLSLSSISPKANQEGVGWGERPQRGGKKRITAAKEHGAGEPMHDGLGLGMQVTKYFVGAPAAHKLDLVDANACKEYGHGTGGVKGSHAHISWGEAICWPMVGNLEVNGSGELHRLEQGPLALCEVGAQWHVEGCPMLVHND